MPHILKNKQLEIHIDLPSEHYRGARFDWSGKIRAVFFQGTSFAGAEQTEGDLDAHFGRGFYNEFGIDTALGFNETSLGQWFHKIGVGR
ncbi:MAG: hypothetical protein AAF206_25835, partial [Bacteroidota bacterium]